ncbi:pimeloyl-ACP methyl ester carboxylesterase [Micromonospora jinlongensis]|uniref:Pimeloyl-ACP methyl ester carboxylesterase n=1 Tax=Micromonospora jinlongensis TaxID=1287877 RepID=A0A7Y9X527_9ACTN|nr:epoxide hydrolase family protein [Micromonospora jinlongensis]NYH45174.1 pimeloyl-ACP methyl ester carboxylesterase [Micromonospora jinlongensis]
MSFSSFRIDVPDAVLDDLRARLARTRFTDRSGNQPWQGGVDPDYLRDLVSYWHDGFDWRAREAELNAYPQHLAVVGGRKLHFLHVRAARPAGTPAPLPLILSHGWPSSFVEMLPLVDRLTSPAGGGFDVVVPSLPGFGFSEVPDEPVTRALLARTLHELMTGVLGYQRYGAFGGDVGGVVTGWLGALHPEQVAGIHMIHPPFPASFDARPLSAAEQAYLDAEAAYDETDGGYSAIMGTRPDTLAAALADSPAGLAAWIVDKYRDWSDNHGDLANSIDTDTLLTIITLYWATGTIGSSFRQYADFDHNTPRPDITVPAAFTVSTEPSMANFPREIAERACTDIRHWSEPGRGGHFMPLEEPDLLASEMRQFFTSLRP